MNNLNSLYTPDYGERIIEKRTYLSASEVDKEALILLAEMMNVAPFSEKKKKIIDYACGSICFEVTSLADGYCFTGRLSQSQGKRLHYFLTDPYQEGLSLFEGLYLLGFEPSETALQLAKEHLLRMDNLPVESQMGLSGFVPCVDKGKILSLTLEDLKQAFESLKQASSCSYLYFGDQMKKDPFEKMVNDKKPLPLPKIGLLPQVEAKEAVLLFSGEKMTSMDMVMVRRSLLKAYGLAYQDFYLKNFATVVTFRMEDITPEKSLLVLSFEKGDISFLKSRLPLFDIEEVMPFFDSALLDTALDRVRLLKSASLALSTFRTLVDFEIPVTFDSFLKECPVTADQLKAEAETMKLFVEEPNHD